MEKLKNSFLCILIFYTVLFQSLKHDLKITNDYRKIFYIETFGFEKGGVIEMNIYNFKVGEDSFKKEYVGKAGFIIKKSDTDSSNIMGDNLPNYDIDKGEKCLEIYSEPNDIIVNINETNEGKWTYFSKSIVEGEEGFYKTNFVNCLNKPISFELILIQYNIDSFGHIDYLPSGKSVLPTLYAIFTILYFITIIIWSIHLKRAYPAGHVNRVHHLMTILLILKLLSLLFETIEYHYIKTTGSAAGWNIAYYIFAVLKGIMLFILIALIGSGWAFIKPFLAEREKKIFLIVIPLQILDNIAMIITEETAPGSQGWFTWQDIFRLVDIICCGAILIPIIWSIKHLKEGSRVDGQAQRNLQKLKLFRQFYLMVISYIYFTRIVVYLVDATLPFRLVWLGDLFTEAATLLFFCITGYKFRPAANNPYFILNNEEDDKKSSIEMSS